MPPGVAQSRILRGWSLISVDDLVQLGLFEVGEAGLFREVFADATVEVLVRAALPCGVRVGAVGWPPDRVGEPVMQSELGSVVSGDRGHRLRCPRSRPAFAQ